MRKGSLSIVIPAYNESKNIFVASKVISELMSANDIDYKIIFVDDGSSDDTWSLILKAHNENSNITGVSFSRNFGKESAIFAGLKNADSDCAVVIDCDLQHPPEKIIEMYSCWQNGYDVVEAVKKSRGKEGLVYKLFSKYFYRLMSKSTGINMQNASDFKLIDRKVVNALLELKEQNGFFRALSSWVGFPKTTVEFEVQERAFGSSKWSKKSLIKYAISNISSFTAFPLYFITAMGVLFFGVSLIFAAITIYQKAVGIAVEGFTTVILLLIFFGGIIMLGMGVIGYYISKIYEEIKGRPKYFIKDRTEK